MKKKVNVKVKRKIMIPALIVLLIIAAIFAIYLCSIDRDSLHSIEGSYKAAGNDDISSEYALDISGRYLSVYDAGAGNPGISGKIIKMDKDSLTILLKYYENDIAYYWTDKSKTMTLQYEKTDRGIILTNSNYPLTFISDEADRIMCYLLNYDSKYEIKSFELYYGSYEFEGLYYDIDKGWIDEGCPCGMILEDDCRYYDDVVSHSEISNEKFRELLQKNMKNTVIQAVNPYESGVTEIRLVNLEESCLAEYNAL